MKKSHIACVSVTISTQVYNLYTAHRAVYSIYRRITKGAHETNYCLKMTVVQMVKNYPRFVETEFSLLSI